MGKSWIIIAVILVLAISSVVLIIGYQHMEKTNQKMVEPWMFKGAYAKYEGQINSLSIPSSINETIQVIDLNTTHVQIQTNSSIATSFAPTLSDQTTLWINKTNINFQPKGETLARTYDTKIIVRNMGSRECIAYDYTNEAINATYYIDKFLLWPVRIDYTTIFENQTYHLGFSLKDTNIKELN
ncbi:MAG TPA: hypothetical protein VF350_00935 [Candidatus Bathyarchaeia archaeon]